MVGVGGLVGAQRRSPRGKPPTLAQRKIPIKNLNRWSGWADLNRRPLRPKRSALANCATPRPIEYNRFLSAPSRKRTSFKNDAVAGFLTLKTRARFLFLLFCALGLLTACQPQGEIPLQAPTLAATQPPVEVTREQKTVIPTSTPAADSQVRISLACTQSGQMKRYQLDSQLLNATQYVTVYFPPCYDENKAGGYPVLYLLHGQTFNDEMWLDLGANEIADDMIISGSSQPFLMVMPYEDFNNRQPENNQFPNVVTDEIIPFVDTTFNTCAQRACRALGGISRGASWAIRLGLQHWEWFGSVGTHSLPTFRGDLDELPGWLEKIPEGSAPRLYLDIGRFDPEIKTAYKFELVLNEKGIQNEWHLNDGRHNTDYWKAHIHEYLQWYARGWDAIK